MLSNMMQQSLMKSQEHKWMCQDFENIEQSLGPGEQHHWT